jgi:hypothetical protein
MPSLQFLDTTADAADRLEPAGQQAVEQGSREQRQQRADRDTAADVHMHAALTRKPARGQIQSVSGSDQAISRE